MNAHSPAVDAQFRHPTHPEATGPYRARIAYRATPNGSAIVTVLDPKALADGYEWAIGHYIPAKHRRRISRLQWVIAPGYAGRLEGPFSWLDNSLYLAGAPHVPWAWVGRNGEPDERKRHAVATPPYAAREPGGNPTPVSIQPKAKGRDQL